jgi:hypothetical protein
VVQRKVVPLLLLRATDEKTVFQIAKLLVMLTLPVEEVVARGLENKILTDYAVHLAQTPEAIAAFVKELPLDPSVS